MAKAQVTADFTASAVSGCVPLVVNFTDASTGVPNAWNWNLGNGATSTLQNPSATYVTPGQYTVTLTASNGGSSNTVTKNNYIVVYVKPTANFTMSYDTTCANNSIVFTDASIISAGGTPIASWAWDFGDGVSQTIAATSISHPYSTGGTYAISMIITDQNGCQNDTTHSVFITSFPAPTFSATPITGCTTPLTVTFTNTTTISTQATFLWRFGDGTTSALQSPTHTYTAPGNYDVTLVVDQGGCIDSVVVPNKITIQNIAAGFTASTTSACEGKNIVFTNTSNPVAASATWNFGDGTTAATINSTHAYTTAGSYTVTLTSTDANGCIGTATDTITVDVLPVINFSSNITQGCSVPLTVNFSNTSTGGATFNWSFGDGSTSALQNPSHTYTSAGNFAVTLAVGNAGGTCVDSVKTNNYIAITPPVANFTTNPDSGCATLNVTFTSTSTSTLDPITTYDWTFGDGNVSSTAVPTANNSYTTQGIFSPRLIVTTSTGCADTFICTNCIKTGVAPVANFSIVNTPVCYGQMAQFTNLSTGETGWKWLFGDGGNSLIENATHQYADTGTFQIKLVAFNNGCSDTSAIQTIRINGPKAQFTRSMNCSSYYTVVFNSTSVMADSLRWDFGDGTPNVFNNTNPSHTYATRGSKTVTLIAYNYTTGCADTTTLVVTIAEPLASFTTSAINGCYPFAPSFTSTSQDASSYLWNFGVLTTLTDVSALANPTYTYTVPDSNIVQLIITDVNGCKDTARTTLYTLGPIPGFQSNVLTGCTPLPITFTDASISDSTLVQWTWNFGDGSPAVITTTNLITHTYTAPGNYAITMTVRDTNGCVKTKTVNNFVQPTYPFPSLSIDTFACRNDVLTFNAAATVAVGAFYNWDFGDGTTATTATNTTTHSYIADNYYKVTLTVVDVNGCDSTISDSIRILKPTANFSITTLNSGCGTLQAAFNDLSTGLVTSWLWDFGTGSGSTLQNPGYTYTQAGTFNTTLIVTNAGGCTDTLTQIGVPTVPGPVGTYTCSPDSGCNPLTVTLVATSPNAETYVWDMGNGQVISGSDSVVYTYTSQGTYNPVLILSTTMTSGAQCALPATNLTGPITVINLVNVTLSQNTFTLVQDSLAFVTATPSGGNYPYSYNWSPNTNVLSCDTCSSSIITGTGSDMVYYLTVSDSVGCVALDSVIIVSVPCVDATKIPNIFSPNGDGNNDVFYIPGICGGENYIFQIFNRWGILMFTSNLLKQTWDGRTTSGIPAEEGTYYFILEISGNKYKGFFQLLR